MIRKNRCLHPAWLPGTFLVALLAAGACGGEKKADEPAPAPAIAKEPARAEAAADAAPAENAAERAARVHRDALVLDAHCDTLMRVVGDGYDLGSRNDEGHVDFPRMAAGGVDAQVFAVWVDPRSYSGRLWKRAGEMIDALHREVGEHSERVGLAQNAAEARELVAGGKLAAFLGVEGGYVLEDEPSRLAELHERGVRYVTLTWWNNTSFADGSGDEPEWHGLNELGREIVREMNRLGIVVDVSHASDETFRDVLEVSERPVIASHSCTRALHDHHRNLSDEMLRALAKNGGVVGINFVASFLDAEHGAAAEKLREKLKPEMERVKKRYGDPLRARKERWKLWRRRARAELPPVSIDKVIDHLEHAAKVAGVDHVGLGSDFDGFSVGPVELGDCSRLPLITEKLLERGFSDEDVTKILGGNFLRVFSENEGD
ncbi:MAG: dipeptidase [Polyangia bacterium]